MFTPKYLGKAAGSTVQIKIPVVATVIQRCGKDGNLCMAVQSPGPTEGSGSDTYVLSTTENGNSTITSSHGCDGNKNGDGGGEENLNDAGMLLQESHIEFLDESGNVISADDFNKANQCKLFYLLFLPSCLPQFAVNCLLVPSSSYS